MNECGMLFSRKEDDKNISSPVLGSQYGPVEGPNAHKDLGTVWPCAGKAEMLVLEQGGHVGQSKMTPSSGGRSRDIGLYFRANEMLFKTFISEEEGRCWKRSF